jgi:polar amino acid transport system substrate-binding protein
MAKVLQSIQILRRRGLPGVMLALLLLSGSPDARAESVLERIERTGVFNAGTRADAMPFGFRNKKGQLTGFAVDLMGEIHRRLEIRLGHPVKLELHEVPSVSRIQMVVDKSIDIECTFTTPTWEREAQVDFSIPFSGSGVRIMSRQEGVDHIQDLQGKRIGFVAGTTIGETLAEHVPETIRVEVPDMRTGFERFSRGELDGLADDSIVLRAMVENTPLKSQVILVPRSGHFVYEAASCILPQNDSAWRDFVNHTLAELLVGVDEYRGAYMDIYERWFGPRGAVYYPLDAETARRLADSVIWLR